MPSLQEVHESVQVPAKASRWRKLLAFFGPAYLVSVGYMDPGNWATDIAGGTGFGYKLVWVLLLSNLVALLLQSFSARLGIAGQLDLAQASRRLYPGPVNLALYLLAELAIAACDLAEVIGMAIGLNLLTGLPLIWGVSITVLDSFLLLFLLNRGMRMMEVFIFSMVGIIGLSFVIELFITNPNMSQVAKGLIPSSLNEEALYIAIGIIGATVMPHNLYLHSALVQTRRFDRTPSGIRQAIRFNTIDSVIALNLAFFVNAAILILAAAAFHELGIFKVEGIVEAHQLLSSLFGSLAPACFAIALIAAGQSSTITGTLAGQIIMEGYLQLRMRPWVRRLITRLLALVPALITVVTAGEKGIEELLVLSQVVLSLQLGFAMVPLIHYISRAENMQGFPIGPWAKALGWIATAIIVSLNGKLLLDEALQVTWAESPVLFLLVWLGLALAIALFMYVLFKPLRTAHQKPVASPEGDVNPLGQLAPRRFKTIAVAVDFSTTDRVGIEHAVSQGGVDAEYILIHAVESAGSLMFGKEISDNETATDKSKLEAYVIELGKLNYKARFMMDHGAPVNVIPSLVNTSEAELLVMGAHGHTGLKDVILGETVNTVRHKVNIPVLIVRAE